MKTIQSTVKSTAQLPFPEDQHKNAIGVQIFNYNGSEITFKKGNCLMISATQMSTSFGNTKRPQFFLNQQSTNEFLTVLSKARNIALTDLVQVKKGGLNPGTWFHEDVALEFARWLSPEFAIWCNDKIKELLTYGIISPVPYLNSKNFVPLEKYNELKNELQQSQKLAEHWETQAEFYNHLLTSTTKIMEMMCDNSLRLAKKLPETIK